MLRDERTGAAVNLTPGEKPADVHTMVAEEVLQSVNHDPENGMEDEPKLVKDKPTFVEGTKSLAAQWLEFGINRKVTKRAVMMLCHGSKQLGFAGQLMEDFVRKTKMNEELSSFTGSGKPAITLPEKSALPKPAKRSKVANSSPYLK